jgi:N-dimethylarginine dimethylaminohydrolase
MVSVSTSASDWGVGSMIAPLRRVLLKHARDAYRDPDTVSTEWSRLGYLAAPVLDRALREYDAFVDVIRQCVPAVEFLPADAATTLDSIYAYDSVVMTPAGAVLCRMGKELRRPETAATAVHLARAGIPILGRIERPGTLEAGDVIWFDENTLAVGCGDRTNDEGIRQFQRLIHSLVRDIVIVPLPSARSGSLPHLMSLISLVDVDLAVTYSPLLPEYMRDWMIARGYTLVEVPAGEYVTLGSNVLTLAPRRCLMMGGNRVTRRRLEAAGADVLEYAGDEISLKGAGGPTCLTRPLLRR